MISWPSGVNSTISIEPLSRDGNRDAISLRSSLSSGSLSMLIAPGFHSENQQPRARSRMVVLTEGVRRCQFATSSPSAASVQT